MYGIKIRHVESLLIVTTIMTVMIRYVRRSGEPASCC